MDSISDKSTRERSIFRVTVAGGIVNIGLVTFKFSAGILGGSAAMIADAVHSLTDFITDLVLLVFVKLSNKPSDVDHDYGHGKYETLATAIMGLALFAVGVMISYNGLSKAWAALQGQQLATPGSIALIAALLSIILKEWAYRFTIKVGRQVHSQAVVANAWDHRSDAFSSIGTAFGIGGAIFLGPKWAVLDPLAAIVVSVFILKAAYGIIKQATNELLEGSLPANIEEEIVGLAVDESYVSEIHNLRTRNVGNHFAMEMHLRLPGEMTLYDAHLHASNIERRLRERFGQDTLITLHLEPLKVNGQYEKPSEESVEELLKE